MKIADKMGRIKWIDDAKGILIHIRGEFMG